jgi:hypothetical protein
VNSLLDVLRDAAPVVLGVFFVYLAFAVPPWIARGVERVLDWVAALCRRR